ncbi:MAG: biopolymer transporter ExbD, partial [Planctomycetota bacterium]|nr:biopolymer transporter ExbD [Planctomycetota bacterium]
MLLKPHRDESQLSIEMAPMIDMVFLLLIFFLVATSFHQEEREMQIALPVAQSAGPI